MGKKVDNSVLDAALSVIYDTADKMFACSAEPSDYSNVASVALADVVMATGSGGDYTIADGSVSGRKVTIAEKDTVTIDASGTATHIALVDVSESALLYVTTCNSLYLTSGQTMTFGEWYIEIRDPT
jgi:hypothetical protein